MNSEGSGRSDGDEQVKARIFISYSRRDSAFADRLAAGLQSCGFDTLIDRSDIYALEDWWTRVEALIAQADTVVFVVTPDAVTSDICQREVRFAASLNKRLAPIVFRPTDGAAVPEALARLNFIFFDDDARFDTSLGQLSEALETDIGWVRKHTEFGEYARRWTVAGRPGPRGLLLRSPVLEEAERWIASRPHGAPAPTEAVQAFIAESRRAATRRLYNLSITLAAGIVVALALAGFAMWERQVAIEQKAEAVLQSNRAEKRDSRMLAEQARVAIGAHDYAAAMRLSMQALPCDLSHPARPVVRAALDTLIEAAAGGDAQSTTRVILGRDKMIGTAALSPDGDRVAVADSDGSIKLWSTKTGNQIATLPPISAGPALTTVTTLKFTGDGSHLFAEALGGRLAVYSLSPPKLDVVVATGGDFMEHDLDLAHTPWLAADNAADRIVFSANGRCELWDTVHSRKLIDCGSENPTHFAISPDGSRLFTWSGSGEALWDVAGARPVAEFKPAPGFAFSAAFSPDSRLLAIGRADGGIDLVGASTGSAATHVATGQAAIAGLAFSPDGKWIVADPWDKSERADRHSMASLPEAPAVSFGPSGREVLEQPAAAHALLMFDTTGNERRMIGKTPIAGGAAIRAIDLATDRNVIEFSAVSYPPAVISDRGSVIAASAAGVTEQRVKTNLLGATHVPLRIPARAVVPDSALTAAAVVAADGTLYRVPLADPMHAVPLCRLATPEAPIALRPGQPLDTLLQPPSVYDRNLIICDDPKHVPAVYEADRNIVAGFHNDYTDPVPVLKGAARIPARPPELGYLWDALALSSSLKVYESPKGHWIVMSNASRGEKPELQPTTLFIDREGRRYLTYPGGVSGIAFDTDETVAALWGADDRLYRIDLGGGTVAALSASDKASISAIAIDGSGDRILVGDDKGGLNWIAATNAHRVLPPPATLPAGIRHLFPLGGDRFLVTLSNGHAQFYAPDTPPQRDFYIGTGKTRLISPPGHPEIALAYQEGGQAFVIDTTQPAVVATLHGQSSSTTGAAISDDGREIAITEANGGLSLWYGAGGVPTTLNVTRKPIDDPAFRADGKVIFAHGRDNSLVVIPLGDDQGIITRAAAAPGADWKCTATPARPG